MKTSSILTAFAAGLLLGSGAAAQEAADDRDWADNIAVFVTGGPASSGVHVRLNGEGVADVDPGGRSSRTDVSDRLRVGTNELEVAFDPAADGSAEQPRRLTVSLSYYEQLAPGRNAIRNTLAESALPTEPPGEACTESFRVWTGPPPDAPSDLKKRYWMMIRGSHTGHLIDIRVNGTTIYTATIGERFFEITPYLVKGPNSVTYDARPVCFPQEVAAGGKLSLQIATGRIDKNGFRWTGAPVSQVELEAGQQTGPFTREESFRGR